MRPLQEWNISRGELDVLSALGLLSAQDVERSVVSAWNPVNVFAHQLYVLWAEFAIGSSVVSHWAAVMITSWHGGGTHALR